MQTTHRRRSHPVARGVALAAAALVTLIGAGGSDRARAADLGPYAPTPKEYVAVAPSPCEEYRHVYTDDLNWIRHVARLFRRQDVRFHRLKRKRLNDGFEGPDISLNAEMTHEQIDVAFKVTEIAKTVAKARRLACATPARLNLVENEAVRIRLEVAEAVLWVDPLTYQ